MPDIDQAHATALVLYSVGAGAPAPTVLPLHFRLMAANGTWTDYGAELPTGGGYVPGTGITPVPVVLISPGAVVNAAALTQRNMPQASVLGGELWDSSPRRLWLGKLKTKKDCNPGDTFTIAAGAMMIGIGMTDGASTSGLRRDRGERRAGLPPC